MNQPVFAERIRSALVTRNLSLLEPMLAPDVTFGSCVGRAQVLEYMGYILERVPPESCEIFSHPDRLILMLSLTAPGSDRIASNQQHHIVVAFTGNDTISELQVATGYDQALAAIPSPPPAARRSSGSRMTGLAPVLPVRELQLALEHYRRLGFSVHAYEGGGYGYADCDVVSLHLAVVRDLNPAANTSAIYLYVEDADALYAQWRAAGVSGRFVEPTDSEYGLRERAHIDRDGNLIRFGSPLQKTCS